ncbi:MAG: hypothetical protein K2X50_09600 [Gammaproteobacteria bacterium]|nr:hypothetical protein [Gammaproteobacteria bacterium]
MRARTAQSSESMKKHRSTFTEFFKACSYTENKVAPNTVTLQFNSTNTSHSFFNFVKERLPLLNIEFPKVDYAAVHLTNEQYFYCQRQAMCERGQLTIAYVDNCLLKTLRADEFDFSYQFILGIIPGENNSRRLHNLRPSQRKQFLIAPDGIIKPRENKQPMYSSKDKAGFSQAQSNTLLDPNALSRAFGFSRDQRNDKLYGIVTHTNDSLFNRLLTDDSGTVGRIFDFDSAEHAENSLSWLKERLYTTQQIEEFKRANKRARKSNPRTNEVLARIRFNPYRSVVSICSDTLGARLLAYDFAQELLEHYKAYAEKNNLIVNPNFKIPIIFYIRKNKISGFFSQVYHDITEYTDQIRKIDEAECAKIYSNLKERTQHYRNNDFEFLLGLPEITLDILLDTCLGEPLAYVMLKNGYTRMLMRLLGHPNPSLRIQIFDALIGFSPCLFKQNDPIIAKLILAEQFDLADKLIQATGSEKYQIKSANYGYELLHQYLLHQGNPRQIQYMDLDLMLLRAARDNEWVTVKLCLKEFPTISEKTLKELFSIAVSSNKDCESEFLCHKNSEFNEMIVEFFNLCISHNKWKRAIALVSNPVIYSNKSLLGSALISALKTKQSEAAKFFIQAGALPENAKYTSLTAEGVVYPALSNQLFELVGDAIILDEKINDDAAPIRHLVALHLAREIGHAESIACLEQHTAHFGSIDLNKIKTAICYLFISALYKHTTQLAESRLLSLCHQYQLLPVDNHNIYDALGLIIDYYHDTVTSLYSWDIPKVISYFVKLYLLKKDIKTLVFILNKKSGGPRHYYYHSARNSMFNILLDNLNDDTLEIIRAFLKEFIDIEPSQSLKEEKDYDWRSTRRQFSENTFRKDFSEDKILLLFEIGFALAGRQWAEGFKLVLDKGFLKAATVIMTHPRIPEKSFDECMETLVFYPHYLQPLAPSLSNKVTLKHVGLFSTKNTKEQKNCLATLINQVDDKTANAQNHLWDIYPALFFCPFDETLEIEKQFMRLLKPSLLKHLVLIFVIDRFRCHLTPFKQCVFETGTSTWPNLTKAFKAHGVLCDCTLYQRNETLDSQHYEILNVLNDYLANIDSIPADDVIEAVFDKVIELFDLATQADTTATSFFSSEKFNFNAKLFTYMSNIDQALPKERQPSIQQWGA